MTLVTYLLIGLLALVLLTLAALVIYTAHWKRKIEGLVPPRGTFTRISTGRLHYVDRGTGPVILLIHGLGGQLGNYDCGLIDLLARDHRVIALDRPGMGYSDRPANAPCSPDDHAGYVLELIEALELENPLIVGHSLGGAIALALALKAPERIRGLALLAPLTLPGQSSAPAFGNLAIRSDAWRWCVAWTLATPMGFRNAAQVLDAVYGPETMPEQAPIKGGGLLGLRPSHFFSTSKDFMVSAKGLKARAARYGEITLPVSVLYGQQDRILDPALHGEALVNGTPAFRLERIEGGHMIPVTQPQACADFIRASDPARLSPAASPSAAH